MDSGASWACKFAFGKPKLFIQESIVCTAENNPHLAQVVKLSDAVQPLPRQTTQFIHGVPQQFLAVGDKKSEPPAEGEERFSRGAYFMGKAVWAKGYTELLSLLESHRTAGKTEYAIDCYGNGEDLAAVCILHFAICLLTVCQFSVSWQLQMTLCRVFNMARFDVLKGLLCLPVCTRCVTAAQLLGGMCI